MEETSNDVRHSRNQRLADFMFMLAVAWVFTETPPFSTALAEPPLEENAPAAQDSPKPRLAVCFAEGTSPEIIQAVTEAGFGRAGDGGVAYNFGDGSRWSGSQGSPLALTWSLMPDGVFIGVGLGGGCSVSGPSEMFARMDALFASQGGRATWIALVDQSFQRWGEVTGISYERITVPSEDWDDGAFFGAGGTTARGDIRIGMTPVLGGCGGILAFNFFPEFGEMVFNSNWDWSSPSNDHRFFRNVTMHEHGHGLGISHVCPGNGSKIMEPILNTNFDGIQHDEIRAGQRGYGDPFEPNNSSSEATDLGTLSGIVNVGTSLGVDSPLSFPDPPVPFGSILSIDANGEQDYFRFEVAEATELTVIVTPIGLTYDSSSQLFNGNCGSGNFVDSLSIADLDLQVLDVDGTTVLATASANPAGMPEELLDVSLPAAGEYFVRVFEGNAPLQTQLYRLSLSTCPIAGAPQAEVPAVSTNRYLAFIPASPGLETALQVTLVDSQQFPEAAGSTWWVGQPVEICENGAELGPPCSSVSGIPSSTFLSSSFQCEPHCMDWGSLGRTVHVGDISIVPGAEYEIRAVACACDAGNAANFSFPLATPTSPWGDTVSGCPDCPCNPPEGSVDILDCKAVLDRFVNASCAPLKSRVDLEPAEPDRQINITDALACIQAFQGLEYDLSAPVGCQ